MRSAPGVRTATQRITRLIARIATMLALALVEFTTPGTAQSLLDRPPNLSGNWVGTRGQLYFNFLHRFTASSAPERKVSNVPTFTIAAALPMSTLIGTQYATNSQLAPRYPNEWEFFIRNQPVSQARSAPLDLAVQIAYNLAAEGMDGEVSLARAVGPVRVIAAGRILSDSLGEGKARIATAGGAVVRLGRYAALAGDVAALTNRREGEGIAWSAGLQLALPHTPHTLSLQAANTNAYTLQGLSRGGDPVRYGFEFTIPVTLQRWFSRSSATPPVSPNELPTAAGEVVNAGIRSFAFAPNQIEITAGTAIEWKNDAAVAHTVTADDGSFDSGLIEPGATWRHSFDVPGTYPFACTPHPFMNGVVVVR